MKVAKIALMIFVGLLQAAFILMPVPATVQAAEKGVIRLIAPNAPGSTVDFTARLMSNGLGKALGKDVVVENLPGAGGVVGTQQLVKAPKDGFTIGMCSDNHVITPSIYKSIPFDPINDITPISILASNTLVLVVNPQLPIQNVQELIRLAKSKPGKMSYGSAGNGSALHLATALFCSEADVNITHVPFKGGGELAANIMGGHVDMGVLGLSSVSGNIKAGKLRALAVLNAKRSPSLPDVPTAVESGLTKYDYTSWIAMTAPGNLPQDIVKRLNAAALETLKLKEVREGLAAQGMGIVGSTPEEAKRVFETDLVKKGEIVKKAGATVD
ncbi:MAG: tripartite tricarboxylate transporter substrate binding protein [Syntrophales bacterium]|nr:tripartite tricarboxylate transporter substrate binding protein [Syntrophales bacterium]